MPERIQRKRTKGWRMPEGAVYVGRPTKWGNPYRIDMFVGGIGGEKGPWVLDAAHAVELFRANCDWRNGADSGSRRAAEELRGKDLACWCPPDQACHADVLLEWANQ